MTLKRKDLDDGSDPNPDRDRSRAAGPRSVRMEGRSFAGVEYAADEAGQAEERNSGPPQRGNRSDDVQLSDRMDHGDGGAMDDSDANDRSARVNEARGALEAERGTSDSEGTR